MTATTTRSRHTGLPGRLVSLIVLAAAAPAWGAEPLDRDTLASAAAAVASGI